MAFIVSKHPDAEPWFLVDWTDYVANIGSPSISASEWTEIGSSAFTIEDAAVDGLVTKARVVGGLDATTYYLENKVSFSDFSVDVVSFTVHVGDGVPD